LNVSLQIQEQAMSKKTIGLFVGVLLSSSLASAMEEKQPEKTLPQRVDALETMKEFQDAQISVLRQELIALQDKQVRDKHILAGIMAAVILKEMCVIL
jgi:hypothetical protein